ncbi:DNA-packaging protein FI, partial [Undibacterium curvum]|uniref:DNA-packaging protein FI n=1 Tax=Undibacterium curvum TaxID=2762294 RepID=UPI0038B696CB
LIARLRSLGEQLNRDVSLTGTKEELALRVAELKEELDEFVSVQLKEELDDRMSSCPYNWRNHGPSGPLFLCGGVHDER